MNVKTQISTTVMFSTTLFVATLLDHLCASANRDSLEMVLREAAKVNLPGNVSTVRLLRPVPLIQPEQIFSVLCMEAQSKLCLSY